MRQSKRYWLVPWIDHVRKRNNPLINYFLFDQKSSFSDWCNTSGLSKTWTRNVESDKRQNICEYFFTQSRVIYVLLILNTLVPRIFNACILVVQLGKSYDFQGHGHFIHFYSYSVLNLCNSLSIWVTTSKVKGNTLV